MSRPDDLVAYTYQADLYCPRCILRAFHGSPTGKPPIFGMTIEQHLDMVARMRGIDRSDETTFDSSEFPKPVFRSDVSSPGSLRGLDTEYDRCGSCGEVLGE